MSPWGSPEPGGGGSGAVFFQQDTFPEPRRIAGPLRYWLSKTRLGQQLLTDHAGQNVRKLTEREFAPSPAVTE